MVQYRGFASRLTRFQRQQEIQFLESQIESLQLQKDALGQLSNEDGSDYMSVPGDAEHAERPRAIPRIEPVDWHRFKNRLWCDCGIYSQWAAEEKVHRRPHAIEVLIGKARYYWERAGDGWMRDPVGADEPNARDDHEQEPDVPAGKLPQLPERIRINSRPVLAFLAELTDSEDSISSKVMLRPYKILIRHQKAIRQHYQELRQEWEPRAQENEDQLPAGVDNNPAQVPAAGQQEAVSQANGKVPENQPTSASPYDQEVPSPDKEDTASGDASPEKDATSEKSADENEDKQQVPTTNNLEAYRDFKCLVTFIDEYILPVIDAYRHESSTTVRFEDLWHLFKPGDHVIVKDTQGSAHGYHGATKISRRAEKNRVYRVFQVAGGRPYLSASLYYLDNAFSSSKVLSSFTIGAYRIAFDGTTFGPVHKQFHISPFKGEKEITSLGVYPLRFDPGRESIESELLSTGKRFLELTTPTHLMYRGMTANVKHDGDLCPEAASIPEEVNGQVVVDFKEARQEDMDWITLHSLPQLIEVDNREQVESYKNHVWENEDEKESSVDSFCSAEPLLSYKSMLWNLLGLRRKAGRI
ncbi:AAA family ATPase [Lasiodiplodia theobromae]|uniref:AAA family ATPase n=1 Tax=Lasiodiplodia theobromae TaxID=45133 RepID=UPI0015C3EDD1|nr:AAA family ATPase [Lasiodiplodia theobromae]KAF4540683.1 AAA family ATPase [Lasiodiplodia theobromae]